MRGDSYCLNCKNHYLVAFTKTAIIKDLSTDNAVANGARPVMDKATEFAMVSSNPNYIWETIPNSGDFVCKGVWAIFVGVGIGYSRCLFIS